MNCISLNTWGGRAGTEKLLAFFEQYKDTDIFCLQEIWSAPYEHLEGVPAGGMIIDHATVMVYGMQEISGLLNEHVAYFRPHYLDNYGLMVLVNKEIPVIEEGDVFVYKDRGYHPEGDLGNHARNIQYVTVQTKKGTRTIINFHGLWNGKGKSDSADRLLQSENIIRFAQRLGHPFVLMGDFNLMPDTASIKKFEDAGLSNLIREYGITGTRTSLYTKPERFADYVFASPGIQVNDFRILPEEVSDHAALCLDFD